MQSLFNLDRAPRGCSVSLAAWKCISLDPNSPGRWEWAMPSGYSWLGRPWNSQKAKGGARSSAQPETTPTGLAGRGLRGRSESIRPWAIIPGFVPFGLLPAIA